MARSGRAGRSGNPLDRFNASRLDRGAKHWENLIDQTDQPPIVGMQPGFNMTPLNEPVSPSDCRRWPNSPMCEGDPPLVYPGLLPPIPQPLRPAINRLTPLQANNFIGINPLSDWGVNNCEAWICATGNLAFWETPPVCVAYRWGDGDCRPPDPEPEEDEGEPPAPGVPRFMPNRSREGRVPGCRYFVFVAIPTSHLYTEEGSIGNPDYFDRWNAAYGSFIPGGFVLPCYGPITGLEITITPAENPEFLKRGVMEIAIHCGGMGLWSNLSIPPFGASLPSYVQGGAFRFVNWVNATSDNETFYRQHRPVSLRLSPPAAVWHRLYGQIAETAIDPNGGFGWAIRSYPGQILRYRIHQVGLTVDSPQVSFKIVPAANVQPWRGSNPWGTVCAPIPDPPPPPTYPRMPDMGCSCADIEAMIDRKLLALLGFNERRRMTFNPEDLVKAFGNVIYANFNDPKDSTVGTVPQMIAAILATNFYRGGYHRLPATVPTSLRQPENILDVIPDEKLHDAMSWQEWLLKAIDELNGEYPIAIKYKNGEGEEQDLKFGNASEALAEIIGLLLSINGDTDVIEELAVKSIIEAMGARMAATTAADNARANADFLGYRSKESQRSIKVSIDPDARNMKDFLKGSTVKTTQLELDDKNDLLDVLRQIMLTVGIIKAVFTKDYEEGDQFPGERMREERRRNNAEDAEWTQFIQETENPPENERNEGTTPDIRDLTPPRPSPTPNPSSTPTPTPPTP